MLKPHTRYQQATLYPYRGREKAQRRLLKVAVLRTYPLKDARLMLSSTRLQFE